VEARPALLQFPLPRARSRSTAPSKGTPDGHLLDLPRPTRALNTFDLDPTTDDREQVYVSDPAHGKILVFMDSLPPENEANRPYERSNSKKAVRSSGRDHLREWTSEED